jgi:hypothetical protein
MHTFVKSTNVYFQCEKGGDWRGQISKDIFKTAGYLSIDIVI